MNILLGPDETSIQDSSVDDHYAYRAGGGGRAYNESALTEPTDRGRSLPSVHGTSTSSRCRIAQRGDGGLYTDCPGRLSCVEMRTCGCSLVSCPPPPPPPVSGGSSVTVARRCQEPASGLYAMRRSPVRPTADQRSKPSVYWQVSGCSEQSFDKPRRTNLATDRLVISGESDDVVTGNRADNVESVGSELDAVSKPDKSPDLVLNGKHRDQKPTGTNSSACTSGQNDRRCNSSTAPKPFHSHQTLDDD